MNGKSPDSAKTTDKVVWIGIGLAAMFWLIESAVHVFIFNEGDLIQQVLSPEAHEAWMRSLVVAMFIAFAIYAQIIITQRRRAEEATKHAYSELNQIFETAADGMRVIDKDFNVLRCNQTLLTLSGVSENEAAGRKCYEVLPGLLCHTPECPLIRIQHGEKRVECDTRKERPDGVSVPCIVTATPFVGPDEKLIGIVEDIKDISDLKRSEETLKEYSERLEKMVEERTKELLEAQEQLVRKEKLATLGQLSGSIAHELRNPLGVIDSSAYFLQRKLKEADDKVQEHLDRIKLKVASSAAIIESLLNLTRMKEPVLAKLELTAVTSEGIAASEVPDTVNVIQSFPEEEVPVNADAEQLSLAFGNIITNAVQVMGGKGTLTVTISRTSDDHQAELLFVDTGPGIDPEDLDRIFQPLYSTKAKGIGFGLSITQMVIEKHGGTIEARSEQGNGATMIVRLPIYIDRSKEE